MALDCNQARHMLESFNTGLDRINRAFSEFQAKSKTKEEIQMEEIEA
jgi:hypothetical protein